MDNKSQFDAKAFLGMGQTAAMFGMDLLDKIEIYPNIRVLSSDVSIQASLDRFKNMYPDYFFNLGIAEQNLIGVASGLASEGFKSIAVAQACFLSMRCFEPVRQYLSYMQNNVILVGFGAGFLMQHMGNSHLAIEDISILRSIPGITVLSPADAGGAVRAFEAALEIDTPVYIRLTGEANSDIIYEDIYPFKIGKSNIVHDGDAITIFATGSMVHQTLKAAKIIEEQGITTKIIDVHTIKPFDTEIVDESRKSHLFVSVEEHYIIGGLGTCLAEHISESSGFPPLLRLGVKDQYSLPGDYNYLLTQHRLVPELIAEDILNKYKKY